MTDDDDRFDRPHDTLFRYAFERPEIAEGELRSVLPPAVVNALDFATLRLEPGSLVDPERATLESDLLYRVQLASQDAFVFVLFEHQSSEDSMMPFRMARYMLRIWERWLRTPEAPPARVPVIIPLVLSNAERAWFAPRSMRALYAAPEHVLDALGPHLLDVTIRLDDLPAQDAAAIKARAHLHNFGRLALFALQRSRTAPDFVAELAVWIDLVRDLVRTSQGLEDFTLLIRYIHYPADFAPGSLRALVRSLGHGIEETTMTAADRLRAEGKAEGEAKGEAKLLLKLLALRFGPLPDSAVARVMGASEEERMGFTERVLTAASLNDVLG
ncbi:MAG: hypothetical protein RL385_961 [Pseudomonadota bacterium]